MSGMRKNGDFPTIKRVFKLLDDWRHLPGYQFERRADIFFALFLPEVLEKQCGIKVKCPLIPEFPFGKKPNSKEHRQADYFVLSECGQRGILVELKTDMASKGQEQECSLIKTAEKGMRHLVKDTITIIRGKRGKQERQKYIHLLSYLKELDLVCYEEKKLYDTGFSNRSVGISKLLKEVRPTSWICGNTPKLEALYIQPKSDDKTKDKTEVLDFKTFADYIVKGRGNKEIRQRFADCLRSWACTKAGSPDPLDLRS